MVTTTLTVLGVLFVLACAGAFLALVVGDVRSSRRAEPLDPDARRRLDSHQQQEGQRRTNKGAAGGGL